MFNTASVGRRIADLRKGRNMTQMELADLMGVSYQAVSNWERGNSMPDISKLGDLASALDVSIDALIGNEASVSLARHIIEGDEKEYIRDEKVELEDLVEIAPILKPIQTGEVFDAIVEKREEPMTLTELAGVAPFLESCFLDRFAVDVEVRDLRELAGIAPFLSVGVVDGLAMKAQEVGELRALAGIAPFVSSEVMDDIALRAQQRGNLSELAGIAPFVSREILDDMARRMQADGGINTLHGIAPFLSAEVLGELARKVSDTGSLRDLVPLAPFLPKGILHQLAEKAIKESGLSSIGPIAPFL